MKEYIEYRAWWIESQSSDIINLYQNSEEKFEDHVNSLGLHGLMECLVDWYKEDRNLEEVVSSLENDIETIKDTIGHIDTSNEWRR
jgi:hypothetical protein